MRLTTARRGVVHLELHTDDRCDASNFLSCLFGWQAQQIGPYLSVGVGNGVGGGIVECGSRPAQWVPYVLVDRVAETTSLARGLGATVLLEPREGPAGWRSVVTSPSIGPVALWEIKTGIRR